MLKFGIHDFINAQPILASLREMGEWIKLDIYTETPARLAEQLNEGKLDFAMIPAIEYLRQAETLRLLPGISIASRNQVGTVLLVSKLSLIHI